jgi:glycosyltransferase involved in cell wall biosynthesis
MARILTLTNWFPPHHYGGYEVLCQDVMSRLAARGHQVEVLCSDERLPAVPADSQDALTTQRNLKMYWRDGKPWTPPMAQRLAMERHNQRELRNTLDRFHPDVVSVWHMGALSLSLLTTVRQLGYPMLYSICDEWLIYGLDLDPWSHSWNGNPMRRTAGRLVQPFVKTPSVLHDLGADACFCFLSESTRIASCAASPWSYPIDPVIYPGINRSMFPTADDHQDAEWSWRLLCTSRLDTRKGIDTLIRAFALLPEEATLSLLGRGEPDERDRLHALARALGVADRLRIEAIDRDELPAAYSSHDCFVFPSEWPEPFGMVPIEAMACGTPVVATAMGGSAEFLMDGTNCVVFPPGDEQALAQAINRLAGQPELRRRIRSGGWLTADQFDLASTVDAYEECHVATAEHRLSSLSLPAHPSGGIRSAPPPSTPPQTATPPQLAAATSKLPWPTLHLTVPSRAGDILMATTDAHPPSPVEPVALPFEDQSFASVVCRNVFEFVADDAALLGELRRVLKADGRLLVVTPNRNRMGTLRRRLRARWAGWRKLPQDFYFDLEQRREYTRGELTRLLTHGFTIETRATLGTPARPQRRFGPFIMVVAKVSS